MSLWWRIVLLGGLAALLSGCYVINPESQDQLLVPQNHEVVAGAPYCDTQWPYVAKTGALHLHTVMSNKVSRYQGLLKYLWGDLDHLFTSDLEETMQGYPFDFIGFSDHGEKLTPGERLRTQDLADTYSVNRVALVGFEWTKGGAGDSFCNHLTIYGTSGLAGASIENEGTPFENWVGTRCSELGDLYQWLSIQPEQWVGCFAHPWLGESHFDNFARFENDQVRQRLALIEVGGGSNPLPNGEKMDLAHGERYFQQALIQQHWLSPVVGLDNEFHPKKDVFAQTVAWCRQDGQFDRDDLLEAFLARRTFARVGPVEDLRFAGKPVSSTEYTTLGQAMSYQQGDRVEWQCLVRHDVRLITIDLQGIGSDGSSHTYTLNPNRLPHKGKSGSEVFRVRFVPPEKMMCYYIRVRTLGDHVIALSAPIWINRVEKQPPQDVFETLGFNQLNADPYCAEVATHNLSNLKPTYDVRYEPGQEFGAVVEVDSRYPVVFLVTERDDRTRTVFCRGFANRGEQALWMHKNTTAETEYLSVYVLYKDQPDSWAGHVQLRPNYFSPHEQIYEFDDDLTHRDVTLYYREKP